MNQHKAAVFTKAAVKANTHSCFGVRNGCRIEKHFVLQGKPFEETDGCVVNRKEVVEAVECRRNRPPQSWTVYHGLCQIKYDRTGQRVQDRGQQADL